MFPELHYHNGYTALPSIQTPITTQQVESHNYFKKPDNLQLLQGCSEYIASNCSSHDSNIKINIIYTAMQAALVREELFSSYHSQVFLHGGIEQQKLSSSHECNTMAENLWKQIWNNLSPLVSREAWEYVNQYCLNECNPKVAIAHNTSTHQPFEPMLFETVFRVFVNNNALLASQDGYQESKEQLTRLFAQITITKATNVISIICRDTIIPYSTKLQLVHQLLSVQSALHRDQNQIRFLDVQSLLSMLVSLAFNPDSRDDEYITELFSQLISCSWIGADHSIYSAQALAINCLSIIQRSCLTVAMGQNYAHETAVFCSALLILLNKAWRQKAEYHPAGNVTYIKNVFMNLIYQLYILRLNQCWARQIRTPDDLVILRKCINHIKHFPIHREPTSDERELFLDIGESQGIMLLGKQLLTGFRLIPRLDSNLRQLPNE